MFKTFAATKLSYNYAIMLGNELVCFSRIGCLSETRGKLRKFSMQQLFVMTISHGVKPIYTWIPHHA